MNSEKPACATPLPEGKEFHAFFCFSEVDGDWVESTIARLEDPDVGLRCVDHRRDFHGGKGVVRNIVEFIERSAKFVLVMSPDFVRSKWCEYETEIMASVAVSEREDAIIPVLVTPCLVPKSLKTVTYVEVGNNDHWFHRLVAAIRRTDTARDITTPDTSELETLFSNWTIHEDKIKLFVSEYKRHKAEINQHRQDLKQGVAGAFSQIAVHTARLMEVEKHTKMQEVDFYSDKNILELKTERHLAQQLLSIPQRDSAHNKRGLRQRALQLKELEQLERNRKDGSRTSFVLSESLLQELRHLFDKYEAGQIKDVTDAPSMNTDFSRHRNPWASLTEAAGHEDDSVTLAKQRSGLEDRSTPSTVESNELPKMLVGQDENAGALFALKEANKQLRTRLVRANEKCTQLEKEKKEAIEREKDLLRELSDLKQRIYLASEEYKNLYVDHKRLERDNARLLRQECSTSGAGGQVDARDMEELQTLASWSQRS